MKYGKERILVTALYQTDMEGYDKIVRSIALGKKFIPIKIMITFLENPKKKFYVSIDLELEE